MIDCVLLSLEIAARHRAVIPEGVNTIDEDVMQIKNEILLQDSSYAAVQVSS